MDEFSCGVLLGVLIGEGHFGGDGRQPQVTLRMNVRHQRLFQWLTKKIPGSKLYGPYDHDGRRYFQLMVRGRALREFLIPVLDKLPIAEIDLYAFERYQKMKEDYEIKAL